MTNWRVPYVDTDDGTEHSIEVEATSARAAMRAASFLAAKIPGQRALRLDGDVEQLSD